MKLHELTLRTVRVPLIRPYVLSYRTFTEFEPIIVEARDADGRIGWGEGHISPGSSSETRQGGWAFCREHAAAVIGKDTAQAKAAIASNMKASKVAATALLTAIEMLEDHPLLRIDRETKLPLLTPFNSSGLKEIAEEVEQRLADGFRTFKIKVGADAVDDAQRVKAIQQAIAGARASPVPIMLDEPICTLADVERAACIENIGFCKLKLKRFGGLDLVRAALDTVRVHGMEPVLGDGLGIELSCWMEACVARVTIRNAGEFNGFLKPKVRLFKEPLAFSQGNLLIPAGYTPAIDRSVLLAHQTAQERFVSTAIAASK
jgi:L-alanine-DL-glutamate epimerase-like enolase superfamily enzyme